MDALAKHAQQTDFNPRSREGSDSPSDLLLSSGLYFNPRSREGSDELGLLVWLFGTISIHAPVKGATRVLPQVVGEIIISIHAPVKGATPLAHRPPGKRRISIHAPVKGATVHYLPPTLWMTFQSTLP